MEHRQIKRKPMSANNLNFEMLTSIPVNSTMQDLEDVDESDSFMLEDDHFMTTFNQQQQQNRRTTTSYTSRNTRSSKTSSLPQTSRKQENFDSRVATDYFENDEIDDADDVEEDYDNEPTDTREITSITRINQSHKRLLKSFREKYPTSIRMPTDRALSSASSFNSLTDNFQDQDEYDNRFYSDYDRPAEDNDNDDEEEDVDNMEGNNLAVQRRRSAKAAKTLSKSDLGRIYKELNEIHNKLVVSGRTLNKRFFLHTMLKNAVKNER